MTMTRNRLLSGVLAALYIFSAFYFGGAGPGFKMTIFLILPLACIWLSEPMGGYVGLVAHGMITSPTPAIVVCIGGWLLLLLPLVIRTIYSLMKS